MTLLVEEQYTFEPDATSLYGRFTGAGSVASVILAVDGGSVEFVVGETVTGSGGGSGTIAAINDLAGTWSPDAPGPTGSATLVLVDVTTGFINNDEITGSIAGLALVNGAEAVALYSAPFTSFKGKGIVSVTTSNIATVAGEISILLDDKVPGLLNFKAMVISTATADDWEFCVTSPAVDTTGILGVSIFKNGAAHTPDDTEIVLFEIVYSGSTVRPLGY